MAIHYLDVDDEITSAASRMRSGDDVNVAIVLPPGSRVATSRINFRLLAREAQARHRRLSIVTPEAATRALAASAGLPSYASVAEYESAQSDRSKGAAVGAGGETAAALDELAATVDAAPASQQTTPATRDGASRRGPEVAPTSSSRTARPHTRRRIPLGALAFLALLIVVLAASAFGAYMLLPTATISITPREDAIAPIQLTVKVDPSAKSPDAAALVAPGIVQNFAVSANGTFPATGQKVSRTPASGIVTFSSENTAQAVGIPAGTHVWTANGTVFLTQSGVTVPRADFASHTLGTVNVAVVAQNPGPSGNVAAGAIVNVPGGFGNLLSVSNASATTGGTQTVTHLVQQSDIDAAKNTLTSQLNQQFNSKLTDPSQTPANGRLFPDTAQLGTASFDPDPATLLNQAAADQNNPTFALAATANGTATAADLKVVRTLAEGRLTSSIQASRTLVAGSIDIQLGQGVASGSVINVPVTAAARTIPKLDLNALKTAVKGKSPDEAKKYLSQFGAVSVSVSPDWLPNLPGNESQINLEVVTKPAASPTTSSPASPTPPPSASPPATPTATPTGAGQS